MNGEHSILTPVVTAVQTGGTTSAAAPAYDRTKVTAGMAHIGVGNFHRVHQGVYLDDLLGTRSDHNEWGIVGIGLRAEASSKAKAIAYQEQDGLYTVSQYTNDGQRRSRIVGSMVEYMYGPADYAAVVRRLSDPSIRIVSLTITEGGYNLDEISGEFRVDEPDVADDLKREHPRTVFGILTAALAARRSVGVAPFTVLSCDNLRQNGDTARRSVVGYARNVSPELAVWIERSVAFPNSMVDRIAPTVSAEAREKINAETGIDDGVPALTEEYRQWVVEDIFPTGRPAWEAQGVELRPDVERFESIKGRILNASHMLLSYPAALAGYRRVSDAASDPAIAELLTRFMAADAAPMLDAPSDVSLVDYQAMVVRRFANPYIPDTVLRVAHDGAAKLPVFHRSTAEGLLATGGDVRREALLIAAFRRYILGIDDHGDTFEVIEPHLTTEDWALLRSPDPVDALNASPFAAWGLTADRFVNEYRKLVSVIAEDGIHAAITYAMKDSDAS